MPARRKSGPNEDHLGKGKGQGKKRRTTYTQSDSEDEEKGSGGGGKFADSVSRGGNNQDKSKPAELFRKDLISAMKMPDSEPLLMEEYILITDPWRQDWEKGVQVPVNPDANKQFKAVVRPLQSAEKGGSFKLPDRFLMVHDEPQRFPATKHEYRETNDEADLVCRYDLDDLDVAWLEVYNNECLEMGQDPVPEFKLERVMELLETRCYENMQKIKKNTVGLGSEFDENSTCNVCQSPDSEDDNEMVFCDGCDVCVHQSCYGVQNIPEGKWYCKTCALGIKPQCELCPKKGGAMKPTKSGHKWSHVSCALWIPEVSIGDPDKMEPITNIKDIPASRWNLTCSLCKIKQGAPIQCHRNNCATAFHVTCAFDNKLDMKTEVLDDDDDEDGDNIQLKAYCQKHSSGAPGKSGSKTSATERERADARSQKIAELEEKFFTCVTVDEVVEALSYDSQLVSFIYEYWKVKRKANFGRPLLAPKAEEEDMLVKQQEGSMLARQKMFVQIRQDLERVRNLCYMISKREKERRRFYKTRQEVFNKQLQVILAMTLSPQDLAIVVDANHSDTIYDNPQLWNFTAYGGDDAAATATSQEGSESDASETAEPPSRSRTERVRFPERTQEELHPSNPWKISKALQDKVHSKIFRTKKPKAYVNGTADRTQKKLALYFKPLPRSLERPNHLTHVQLYGSCPTKIYQDVDNEVSICVGEEHSKENYSADESEDSEIDIITDNFLFPKVSDQFPNRVTRSRLTENISKIWNSVSGL